MQVQVTGDNTPKSMKPFNSFGFSDVLLDNLLTYKMSTPTPFQSRAIPIIMSGRDLMAKVQTSSATIVSWF